MISNQEKIILVIIMYKIPCTINRGMSTLLAQYNIVEAKARSPSYYRKHIFTEIK